MFARIAWGFCRMAFEASRDQCFPRLMQSVFQRFGVMWFWIALLLERRALEIVRDMRAAKGWPKNAGRVLGVVRASRRRAKRLLGALSLHGINFHLGRVLPAFSAGSQAEGEDLAVAAWSLPGIASIQALGLGKVWVVHCPLCHRFHTHLPDEGARVAPCSTLSRPRTYVLKFAGELPTGLRERFRLSMSGDWPKLLLQWPRHESEEALQAA